MVKLILFQPLDSSVCCRLLAFKFSSFESLPKLLQCPYLLLQVLVFLYQGLDVLLDFSFALVSVVNFFLQPRHFVLVKLHLLRR